MNVLEAIAHRRSVRHFDERPVEKKKLKQVLEAGRMAPSAGNRQEWRYVVVTSPTLRSSVAAACQGQRFVEKASVIIVACAHDTDHVMPCGNESWPIDVAISMDHMTLAAVELGLGTCWIGAFNPFEIRRVLNIPEDMEIVSLLVMGYPVNDVKKEKNRLAMGQICHADKYGNEMEISE